MARTSNFANIATTTRASKKTDAGGWDFTNGGTVGTLTEYDNNVASIHAAAGLLVEEATTNEIRNPRGEGASGSTEPTNWAVPSSWDAIATWSYGTLNGWPYARVDFNGTPSGTCSIDLETSTQISAAQGDDWTFSAGLALATGDLTNIDYVRLRHREGDSGGGFLTAQDSEDVSGFIDSNHRRFAHAAELQDVSTDYVRPQIMIGYTSGAVNFGLYIFAAQTENKAYPTSPVFPTVGAPAASTRAADDVTIPNGAWAASSNTHSVFMEYQPAAITSGTRYLFALGDATNQIRTFYRPNDNDSVIVTGGSTVASLAGFEPTAGASNKLAVGLDSDNFAQSQNGQTQITDTSGASPVITGDFNIGRFTSGGFHFNGYLKDLRYWPRRLSNAELEALVGN